MTTYVAADVVGVNDPITLVGELPPILYWTESLGVPVALLTRDTIDRFETVNVVEASLVILNLYHLLLAMLVAKLPLNPEPEMLPPAALHVTPLPLDI